MKEARPAFDWAEAYARLRRTSQALEEGSDLPPDEARRILTERARALAHPLAEDPVPTGVLDLLVFSLAEERYGIETAHVREVTRLRGLTPVPGTPPFLLGVVNYRERILAVLDLRRLFDLAGAGVTEASRLVAVETGDMTFGMLADAVAGIVRVSAQEVTTPPPVALRGARWAFARGVTRGMVVVLDLEALARDRRIVVNDEVG